MYTFGKLLYIPFTGYFLTNDFNGILIRLMYFHFPWQFLFRNTVSIYAE
jgi:hypothetical protein